MKQPDKTIAQIFAPTLANFTKKYDYGLGYVQSVPYGIHEVLFISDQFDPGVRGPYGFYEVNVALTLGYFAINEILNALDARERLRPVDRTGPTYTFGDGSLGSTVIRSVVSLEPFDAERDRTYEIKFDALEADTHVVHDRFKTMMAEDGVAWFERYADPVNISLDINDAAVGNPSDQNRRFLFKADASKAETGLAAACISEPERVPQIYEDWLEWQRRDDAHYLPLGRKRPFVSDMQRRFDVIIEEARLRGYGV